jgi:hypothetical protein
LTYAKALSHSTDSGVVSKNQQAFLAIMKIKLINHYVKLLLNKSKTKGKKQDFM